MAKINWTDEAEKWLRDIHEYIAHDNPVAATKVTMDIYKRAQVIASFP
jgi:toxin ParE1/3/4